MTLAPDDPRHGTANGYGNHRCRCSPCREANTAYIREARERAQQTRTCPNCGGPGGQYSNGTCHTCYAYESRTGVPRPPDVYDRSRPTECSVELCPNDPSAALGLCWTHYGRQRRGHPLLNEFEQALYNEVLRLRDIASSESLTSNGV